MRRIFGSVFLSGHVEGASQKFTKKILALRGISQEFVFSRLLWITLEQTYSSYSLGPGNIPWIVHSGVGSQLICLKLSKANTIPLDQKSCKGLLHCDYFLFVMLNNKVFMKWVKHISGTISRITALKI